eukprot:c15662_g2_i1 orf=826-2223(+)
MRKPSCHHLPHQSMAGCIFRNLLVVLLLFQGVCKRSVAAKGSSVLSPTAASNISLPSSHSEGSQGSSMLLPSSPIYPVLPSGPTPQPMSGSCNLNISTIKDMLDQTAGDCTAPLAMYVGNVICCPQFKSMLHILGGERSLVSGYLASNDTEAVQCLAEITSFLVENGANTTTSEICNVQSANLTQGLCPVVSVREFEQVVYTRKLLDACSAVDPLKECCNGVCQPAITDAAVRLASNVSSSDPTFGSSGLQQVVNDCEGVVFAWLARELGADAANSAFRILSSCKVNRVCPLTFDDTSSVVKACSGSSPTKAKCCSSLYGYISIIQKQMLITNVQALECVTLFGSLLKKEGVVANVYNICEVDLKDFSLQVNGNQGCLLRSIPSDIIYDNVSGISFTCDLNDNIPAPWPASSSLTSFPLCANRESLPALPVLNTSDACRRQILDICTMLLMILNVKAFLRSVSVF